MEQLIEQAIVRAYCTENNSRKIVDPDLIVAATKEVLSVVKENIHEVAEVCPECYGTGEMCNLNKCNEPLVMQGRKDADEDLKKYENKEKYAVFSKKPLNCNYIFQKFHDSEISARSEAERLCLKENCKFVVVKIVGEVEPSSKVVWR